MRPNLFGFLLIIIRRYNLVHGVKSSINPKKGQLSMGNRRI